MRGTLIVTRGREVSDVFHQATKAVVTVGGGRGFVVEQPRGRRIVAGGRVVITAAHCLTHLPPVLNDWEGTYPNLVGPLGESPDIWAECLFVDPVSDLGVLGSVDNQELPKQADAYEELMEAADPLPIGDVPAGRASAWLPDLTGQWFRCEVEHCKAVHAGGPLWIENAAQEIVGGMSGSPILHNGSAVGLLSVSHVGRRAGGPGPCLVQNLPGWMLG